MKSLSKTYILVKYYKYVLKHKTLRQYKTSYPSHKTYISSCNDKRYLNSHCSCTTEFVELETFFFLFTMFTYRHHIPQSSRLNAF